MNNLTANYDEPWKEAISEDFDLFLNFFFLKVYNLIDWSKTPVSLDKEIVKLFKLIDSMMTLSEELQKKLELKITDYEESQKMPLLSNMERRGIEKTLKDNIISILNKRFGELSVNLTTQITEIDDIPKLQQLILETISVNSVAEFEKLLQ